MHDAMQDDDNTPYSRQRLLHCCLMARIGRGTASMSTPFCSFSRELALWACVRCSLVWWMWPMVMRRRLQRS